MTCALHRDAEGVGKIGLRDNVSELYAQMDDRLSDLRPYAADDALGSHQASGRNRLQEMLCRKRVHRGHPGEVEKRELRTRLNDSLEKTLHDRLRSARIQRADDR